MKINKSILVLVIAFLAFAFIGQAIAASYDIIISKNPQARKYFWYGVDFLADGHLPEAKDQLKLAVLADDKCFLAYSLLSEIAMAEKDETKAKEYIEKIPRSQGDDETNPHLRGKYFHLIKPYLLGDYAEAVVECDEFIQANYTSPFAISALHIMGRALYYEGSDMRVAWDIFNEADMYSSLMPGTVPAYEDEIELEKFDKFLLGDRP